MAPGKVINSLFNQLFVSTHQAWRGILIQVHRWEFCRRAHAEQEWSSSKIQRLIITGLLPGGSVSAYAAGEEVQAIKVAKESASSGDGNTVKLMGNDGLLMDPLRLLARAVIITDQDNIVRYIQVVPEVTQLPDMQAAMDFAKTLL
jgi:hypothetical protein